MINNTKEKFMNLIGKVSTLRLIALAIAIALTVIVVMDSQITSPGTIAIESPFPKEDSSEDLYAIIPYATAIAWAAFVFTLIWKGRIKHIWQSKGYSYEIFKLLTKMRGSSVRITILRNTTLVPKNKHQLANELEVDR